jgi:enoyl-CoA hydratase/carnithine racemase
VSIRVRSLVEAGPVLLLDLGDGENRFTPDTIAAIHRLLDRVCAAPSPKALVTRAHGKFFSNGLDLGWMTARPGRREPLLRALQDLLARLLELPVPTVAAVQGHAFGAGAMLALAHDSTVMRAGRGFWCLPEVPLGMSFTTGMTELLRVKLPVRTAHAAITTGRRYDGLEAVAAGIADTAQSTEELVLDCATELADMLAGTAHPALGSSRARLYDRAITALRTDALSTHSRTEETT